MKISEISKVIKADWIQQKDNNSIIKDLVFDSRKIKKSDQALFIAIKSVRDGNDFISDAYEKGIRNFLVHVPPQISKFKEANFLLVDDTIVALHKLAIHIRNQYNYPVIGITGSNGKTVVKEWLFQLLSEDHNIVRSPKSYNSQIGIPLSVWQMQPDNTLGIFEAGISQTGEMEKSESIIRPDIGVFTNIAEAHSEGFMNRRQKINEKMMLFRHAKYLVYCADHHELHEQVLQFLHQMRGSTEDTLQFFTWSYKSGADLHNISVEKNVRESNIKAIYKGENVDVTIPYTDNAYIENAIHCWSVMLLLGYEQSTIKNRMLLLQPVAMRLELIHGINNCTIINDTYNSDLTSFHIALDFLEQQKQHRKKTLILSDMLQIGKPDSNLYEEVAELIVKKNIQRIIGIGPAISKHKQLFRNYPKLKSVFFLTSEDFLKKIHTIIFEDEAILLKGARIYKFEKIKKILEQKVHKTVLEINLTALQQNLSTYRNALPKGVKLMVMVKAFSYGSGSYEIANMLQFAGVDYLTVAYVDEGILLRKSGITLPIMVMSPDAASFDRMVSWKLEPEIFSLDSLHQFLEVAATFNLKDYPVHIKLDTGMHRLGFDRKDIESLKDIIKDNVFLRVESIFSHLAGSEDHLHDDFTRTQAELFESMAKSITSSLKYKPLFHLVNSAGIASHKNLFYDMVRLGIGLYGIDTTGIFQKHLSNISTLKTTIAQIKEVNESDTIGYGRKGVVNTSSKIATVSIGYADGYFRNFGNGNAYMLVMGKKAPVVGAVCMDMCMIDITGIEGVSVGDEVIVFGNDLPVTLLADWAKTIPYEIMTSISQRVKRLYVNE